MDSDKKDELIYDLLTELASIDTHDTNLRDAPNAYVAVYDFIAEMHWGGCACRWDRNDKRIATCERHQGWLDVVHEWAERAKAAEQRVKDLETQITSNTMLAMSQDRLNAAKSLAWDELEPRQREVYLAYARSAR